MPRELIGGLNRTPIDDLDFASPVSDLGSKMGIDAINQWPGETVREWGRPMTMTPELTSRVDWIRQALIFRVKRSLALMDRARAAIQNVAN